MSDFEDKLVELKRLLAEAYEHYFKYSDGYCKSSEGVISIHVTEPFYWREEKQRPAAIEIYSYVFGGGRHHYFRTIDDALDEVRVWHHHEMNFDHEAAEAEMEAAYAALSDREF